jgi:hypothetical protein
LAVTGTKSVAAAAIEYFGEAAIEIVFADGAEDAASPHASAAGASGSAWLL